MGDVIEGTAAEIATIPATEPRAVVAVPTWSDNDLALLKRTVAAGTTDLEFELFAKVCRRTGLDPFARQIYAIKRRSREGNNWIEKMTIQTGIDGYRLIAERTGEYAGGTEPEYGPKCECGRGTAHPQWARVGVRRVVDGREWITHERAEFHEYVPTKDDGSFMGLWGKMPRRMIAKCAEAVALRRAFPARFEGVYTEEEMGQAAEPTTTVRTAGRGAPPPRRALPQPVEAPPVEAGELRFSKGQTCPECVAEGLPKPGRLWVARKGPNAGLLQCSGQRADESYCNHVAGAPA